MVASRTRLQIRQMIGRPLGAVFSSCSANGSTSTLVDTVALARGGDDEYNGWQVQIDSTVASGATIGSKTWVSDFTGSSDTATLSPTLDYTTKATQLYEMWPEPYRIEQINEYIDQALLEVYGTSLVTKQDITTFTLPEHYEYSITGFTAVNKVEYESDIGTEVIIDKCDTVWDNPDTDVTATLDNTYMVEGNGCLKLVVAAGCAANDILCTNTIDSTDISECDQVEISIYSSVALAAGDLQLLLDNTASCASPVETLDIPATAINTQTRHIITLANPLSDTAIISVGVKMVTDKGAFTCYVDYIRAVKNSTRFFTEIHPDFWIVSERDSTPTLQLRLDVGDNKLLRITGYESPELMDEDTDTCEVDPEYISSRVIGLALLGNSRAQKNDASYWLQLAEQKKSRISTNFRPNTRWI